MPSNLSRLWWIAAPVLLALALAVPGCGGGGGGTGATFVKAFGGGGMRQAVGLIPQSDGYLLVGGGVEGSGIGLATLDGNGELTSPAQAHGTPDNFGLRIDGAEVRAVTGGWVTTRLIPRGGDNAFTLETTRYRAGATRADAPSVVWRSHWVVDHDEALWNGRRATLASGTRLLAMQARMLDDGGWTGVLAVVVEQAWVDSGTPGDTVKQARWRLSVWRLNAAGGLQSSTVLGEGMGSAGARNFPSDVGLVVGLDGAYAAWFRESDKVHVHRAHAQGGRLWSQEWAESRRPVLVHGDDTYIQHPGAEVHRYDVAGRDQGRVLSGSSAARNFSGACKAVGAAGYCVLVSDLAEVYDLDGMLLGEGPREPTDEPGFRSAAFWPDGDLRVVYTGRYSRPKLLRIHPVAFNPVSVTPTTPQLSPKLSDEGLVETARDFAGTGPTGLRALAVFDDQLRPLEPDPHADRDRVIQAFSVGTDQSLVLTESGSVLRLERDRLVGIHPPADDGPGPQTLSLLPNGQGYMRSRSRSTGSTWSLHNLDGTPRGPQAARNGWTQPIVLPDGGLLLLDGVTTGDRQEALTMARMAADGSARWWRVHRLPAGEFYEQNATLATALLPDGKVLLVSGRSSEMPLRLMKIDPDTGELLMHRVLQPATRGYRWNWQAGGERSLRLVVTSTGHVWLGFTSEALVWHETAVTAADGTRRPMPYGGRNLALVRLDDTLKPDRLRVYGAGGDEDLVDLHAADDGGLLVAATTTSIGLDLGDGTAEDFQQDALVLRLNGDGLVEGGCPMLIQQHDDAMAAQFLGAGAPLAGGPAVPLPLDSSPAMTTTPWQQAILASPSFQPAALQPARMCLAGLGTVPPAPPNAPPVATAGDDQTVMPLARVTLAGAGTDSDGAVVRFAWTQRSGPAVTLDGAGTATATFTAPAVAAAQVLTFELTVTDDTGLSGSDVVAVTVNPIAGPANQPPAADAGADQTASAGQAVTLAGQGSDSDGTVTAYAWQQLSGPPVTLAGAGTASATFTAPAVASAQVLSFALTVTDDDGATSSDTVSVTVQPPPASGSFTLTVQIDGGPGIAMVRTGEQPTPQLECPIDYAASASCSTRYAAGSTVLLYGEPSSGMVMDWTGCTMGLDDFERPVCRVTMDSDRTVRVLLRPAVPLAVTLDGQVNRGAVVFSTGSRAVLYCVSPGADAGTVCEVEVPQGDALLLDWSNPAGFGVQAWSGCTPERDANNRLVCRLTMDTARTVTATFGP